MEFLLNSAQMKQCDGDTIERIGIPSLVLMERASLCVVEEMQRAGLDLGSVLVICGSGNNGGDGFAAARILDERGIRVNIAFVGREQSLSEETRIQKKICENCGIKISTNFMHREYTTIVDAVFGIGLSRAVEGSYADVIDWVNQQDAAVVAVDIPSGISADTGEVLGTAVKADLTVTFAYRKIGQILYPGAEYCGKVVCRDIGILGKRFPEKSFPVFTYGKEDLQRAPLRRPYSNKGTYGKVLLIAGSEGMSGAACMSALAAYRTGCGLVRVFTPACNRAVVQTYLPEAVVTAWEGTNFPKEQLLEALSWSDVTGIGPGLGKGEVQREILAYVLQHYDRPLVIDADGLNLLSEDAELLYETKAPVILTPHIGEMMRLTASTKDEILGDILLTARRFAGEYQVICALKDARTVVSDGVRTYVNTSGNSGMATGGSGDVLTGVICGLLAQRMTPFDAAALGVYLHGCAGDRAREERGAYGMTAGDITEQLGNVLKTAESETN
ncbi:MAG: NAD(P)H-hydrate dehydratase [Lachnospiraceae bacterium]|nr:NAD(P)H-hydrate dehydratase [Lachnospiraceae bacterium]